MKYLARFTAIATTIVATVALSAPAALAYRQPPQPTAEGGFANPAVTHTTHGGLATWAVLIIAIGAVVVGVALAESVRSLSRRRHGHKLATA